MMMQQREEKSRSKGKGGKTSQGEGRKKGQSKTRERKRRGSLSSRRRTDREEAESDSVDSSNKTPAFLDNLAQASTAILRDIGNKVVVGRAEGASNGVEGSSEETKSTRRTAGGLT